MVRSAAAGKQRSTKKGEIKFKHCIAQQRENDVTERPLMLIGASNVPIIVFVVSS